MFYRFLNARFKEDMRTHSLSEDELRQAAGDLKKKQKKMFIWWIVATVFVDGLLIYYITSQAIKGLNTDPIPVEIVCTTLLSIAVCLLFYFAFLGIIKIQFNKALKNYYPDLLNELKL